jgi:hypothetical protein
MPTVSHDRDVLSAVDTSVVASRDGGVRLGASIDVRAVVDAVDPDGLCGLVDAIKEAVGAAAGAVLAGQFAAQWFADPAGVSCQVAKSELDHRGQ